MYQCLIGVYYLLKVNRFVAVVGEGCVGIEVFVSLNNILYWSGSLDDSCAEDAASKVATVGDEVNVGIEISLNLLQTLANLSDVLVLEWLVDAQIVVTPREVRCSTWLLTCTSRPREDRLLVTMLLGYMWRNSQD